MTLEELNLDIKVFNRLKKNLPVQLTLNVTENAKGKQYEALLMIREAINMLIEANRS